jgi:hypothetical protein
MKSPLTLVKSLLAVAGVAALSAISAAPASAFNFSNIDGGDPVGDAYANSFQFNVVDQNGSVLIDIFNNGTPKVDSDKFIGGVFIDDNGYLSNPWANVNNAGSVEFIGGASKDQLPQGGNGFDTDYAFFSKNGAGNLWGIQAGEKLGLSFGGNYQDVIAALTSGDLKIGLHVQALPNDASDWVHLTFANVSKKS